MLLSFNHKFITISIPKTGTASLRSFLAMKNQHWDSTSNTRIVDLVSNQYSIVFKRHGTLLDIIRDSKKVHLDITSYFTFTFVRNPWARYVSHMFWTNNKFNKNFKLDFFINEKLSQYDFVKDDHDNIGVDYIAKFENYEQELKNFCRKFNLNVNTDNIPHLNKSKKYDYKDFYTKDLIDKVYEKEHKIIDLMGYTYD